MNHISASARMRFTNSGVNKEEEKKLIGFRTNEIRAAKYAVVELNRILENYILFEFSSTQQKPKIIHFKKRLLKQYIKNNDNSLH